MGRDVVYTLVRPMATDPVCLGKIDEDDAAFMAVHKSQKYYFCCSTCKSKFEKNPQKYTQNPADQGSRETGSCS